MDRRPIAALFLLAACGAAEPESTLTVLAASSLTEAFTELESAFERDHPGTDVRLSFAGSQALATQVRHGIAADVYASADAAHIEALAAEGLVQPPRTFAQNTLVIALAKGHAPVTLHTLPTVQTLVLGGEQVPLGRYTTTLLDAAERGYGDIWRSELDKRVASREPNARLVVAKVALGEADAAIVYATDAAHTEGIQTVALPAEIRPTTAYLHARLRAAPSPELAQAWLDFVESEAGRKTLVHHGFR